MQSISVFPDILKIADFQWKNADVSRTQGVFHVTYVFFGSFLDILWVPSFINVKYVSHISDSGGLGGGELFGRPSENSPSWMGLRLKNSSVWSRANLSKNLDNKGRRDICLKLDGYVYVFEPFLDSGFIFVIFQTPRKLPNVLDQIIRHFISLKRWDVRGGAQAGFESLALMSEGIEKEKLFRFVGETEMEDLGVVGILGPENFEWEKERCEAEFVKYLDLNE